jgi:Spy/CpxP family protein refolding chaperone
MTKSKWTASALLIAVFILGALSGGAAAGFAERSTGERHQRQGGMVEHLAQDLDLTTEQQDSVRAILERHKASFHDMRERIGEEIRSILTPDQQDRYQDLTTKMRRTRKHDGKSRDSTRRRSP